MRMKPGIGRLILKNGLTPSTDKDGRFYFIEKKLIFAKKVQTAL